MLVGTLLLLASAAGGNGQNAADGRGRGGRSLRGGRRACPELALILDDRAVVECVEHGTQRCTAVGSVYPHRHGFGLRACRCCILSLSLERARAGLLILLWLPRVFAVVTILLPRMFAVMTATIRRRCGEALNTRESLVESRLYLSDAVTRASDIVCRSERVDDGERISDEHLPVLGPSVDEITFLRVVEHGHRVKPRVEHSTILPQERHEESPELGAASENACEPLLGLEHCARIVHPLGAHPSLFGAHGEGSLVGARASTASIKLPFR
mmetsp:Transcript_16573/g.32419  ORF Transcript_16573/g.32419 Transcript_16573/m.32419 type:complete len:270 (-) Transcript_16573:1514-2323(-)